MEQAVAEAVRALLGVGAEPGQAVLLLVVLTAAELVVAATLALALMLAAELLVRALDKGTKQTWALARRVARRLRGVTRFRKNSVTTRH